MPHRRFSRLVIPVLATSSMSEMASEVGPALLLTLGDPVEAGINRILGSQPVLDEKFRQRLVAVVVELELHPVLSGLMVALVVISVGSSAMIAPKSIAMGDSPERRSCPGPCH